MNTAILIRVSYPMPTIALINGHGFAGALMTAMMHDYRIMNPHRGYLCLNEVELGVPLRPAMSSVFRQKCSPTVYRTLVLEGRRFKVHSLSYWPHTILTAAPVTGGTEGKHRRWPGRAG
jgi:enoyl-CoA hydratase/carnithine racemase